MYNTKALRSRLSNLETNNIDIMTNEYQLSVSMFYNAYIKY